jgi:hypothetical protein
LIWKQHIDCYVNGWEVKRGVWNRERNVQVIQVPVLISTRVAVEKKKERVRRLEWDLAQW